MYITDLVKIACWAHHGGRMLYVGGKVDRGVQPSGRSRIFVRRTLGDVKHVILPQDGSYAAKIIFGNAIDLKKEGMGFSVLIFLYSLLSA